MKSHSPLLLKWLGVALALRMLSAGTHSTWFHPDEWYQTVEFASYLANGVGSYSQEFGLHLRNLSWPFLLSLPLRLSELLFPGQVAPRLYLMNLFIGLTSLAVPWAWHEMMKARGFSRGFMNAGMALLLLPWFTIYDSISPRNEQSSMVAAWVALAFLARGGLGWAGFWAVGITAFRYPSGLISLGIALAVVASAVKRRELRTVGRFSAGVGLGLLVFGLPDWIVYGRPWESLWMYLQYNVFTGLSSTVFGAQPVTVYWEFFSWHWMRYGIFIPAGLALLGLAVFGLWRGLMRWEAWAIAAALYGVGHAATAHKEGRFMLSFEGLLLWGALLGAGHLLPRLKPRWRRPVAWAVTALFALNAPFLLKAVWGETWRAASTYWEVDRHVRDSSQRICGIVTVKVPMAPLFPPGGIPIARHAASGREPSFKQAKAYGIDWYEHAPECDEKKNDRVLLHLFRPDTAWDQQGCQLLDSAVLAWFPKSRWPWLIEKNYVNGPWYSCPSAVLKIFRSSQVVHLMAYSLGRHERLPPLGISGEELRAMGKKAVKPPADVNEIFQ